MSQRRCSRSKRVDGHTDSPEAVAEAATEAVAEVATEAVAEAAADAPVGLQGRTIDPRAVQMMLRAGPCANGSTDHRTKSEP